MIITILAITALIHHPADFPYFTRGLPKRKAGFISGRLPGIDFIFLLEH